jgi:uncharacterized protein (DUF849 family)
MSRPVVISCAITGGADSVGKHPAIPVTPEQIATSAIEAAEAGAAAVHIHVRNPQTGLRSMEIAHYREVVDRICSSGSDVIINLTTGPGGLVHADRQPLDDNGLGAQVLDPELRYRHVAELRPEICSLDMGTMNFGNNMFVNSAPDVAKIASFALRDGVRPELEVFQSGDIMYANHLIKRGEIAKPAWFQLCLGISWSAPATPTSMAHMASLLPEGSLWSAFGIAQHQFPMAAQAVLLGGHVRVGFEDNLYLTKGVYASTNAALVERAVKIVELLGEKVATKAEARQILGLTAQRKTAVHVGDARTH